MQLSDKALIWIGGGVIALAVIIIKWALDRVLRKVDQRLDERDKENEEDVLHSLKGQQVVMDCLHEMLRHMITGDHIADLERVQTEMEGYRQENKDRTLKKAAKYESRR
jgi:hypothetical protein